jgi:hypothetical protein
MITAHRGGLVLALLALVLSGCSIGPGVIRCNLLRYNKAVIDTENEQLLLNLVRLKYRDPPKTLAVGSVTSSFNMDLAGPTGFLTGPVGRGTNWLAVNGHITDGPTVSITPLGGQDFVTGMVSPIPLQQIVAVANTGWDLERLLRMMVHTMNGLDNVPIVAGSASERVPRFAEFVFVAKVLGDLQHEGALELATHVAPIAVAEMSEPLPVMEVQAKTETTTEERKDDAKKDAGKKPASPPASTTKTTKVEVLKATDLMTAADKQYLFHHVGGGRVVLQKTTTAFDMNLAPAALHDPQVNEVTHLLKVVPGQPTYRLFQADGGYFKRLYEGPGTDIVVGTRSVVSTMLFLSKGVEAPLEHYQQGLVSAPLDEQGRPFDWAQVTAGLFHVCVQKHKPKCAFVAVKYRGYWFYIPETDLTSKSTFALLEEMIQVQITRGTTQAPILTLPVNAGGGGGRKGG